MSGDLSGRLPIAGSNDELDRLAGNLNVMLERIEALMHGLKEVTDNIAHDLKTPLTRLRNRAEEALRTAEDELQYRAALERTIEESDALIRTFNALLMIARAESGQARDGMTTFDAAEIAHGIGELYEPLADDKGLTLRVEAPDAAPMHGNRELISQALANLVDNAIKYAAPDNATLAPDSRRVNGAQPEIVVKAAGEGDRILLTVADTGPGIPEDDRARAVERFVRLEQSRSQPGSGLGLSLANAVARLHGGELRLEDNAPGLRSVLALPRGVSAAPAIRSRRPAKGDSGLPSLVEACGFRPRGDAETRRRMAAFATTADESGARTLAARIVTAPQLSAPDAAQKRLDGWLAELDGNRRRDAAAAVRRASAGACADPRSCRRLAASLGSGVRRSGAACCACSNPIPRPASTRSWPTRWRRSLRRATKPT